ncbi:hypothetical protein ABZV29_40410 [Streptomyces sp. NPDC005236]|uniref:hypothetical protein n=1 Tax=Streptomyces sp. NPDC005236 TaxID=3157028 RepID=UPI0033BD26A0
MKKTVMKARFIVRTSSAAVVTGALGWFVLTGGVPAGSGSGAGAASGAGVRVADEAPGYAVEDFNYPGADRILAEQKITLKRGDGHVVLADCASATDLIEVMARAKADKICFRVTGNSGWLSLEIPAVYSVKGNDYTTQVDMSAGSENKTFDINKNAWTGVGESADEQGRDFMLMEIRSTK